HWRVTGRTTGRLDYVKICNGRVCETANQRMLFWVFCAATSVAPNEEPATAAHFVTSRRETPDLLLGMASSSRIRLDWPGRQLVFKFFTEIRRCQSEDVSMIAGIPLRYLNRRGGPSVSLGVASAGSAELSQRPSPRTCQLVAPELRERHQTCLASRISMASTYGSLRQRLALRSASARLSVHTARL